MSSDSSAWLVKSNGRILGPFTKDEVDNMLRSKEIVVLDEVAEPFRRWRYIRDHQKFIEIVEEVRKLNFGSNEDHTFTLSTAVEDTMTSTEKLDPTITLTEEIAGALIHATSSQGADGEIVITDIEETPTQSNTVMARVGVSNAGYSSAVGAGAQPSQSDWTSKALWTLAILVVLSVGGYVFYERSQTSVVSLVKPANQYYKEGLEHYYAGDHDLALEPLIKAYEMEPENLYYGFLIAPILIQNGPEGYTRAEQIIEKLKGPGSKYADRVLVTEGLLFLKRQQYNAASEILLKSVEKNPFSWEAYTNLGSAFFMMDNFTEAKNYFDSALKIELEESTSRGEAYLMRAQSELELWLQSKEDRYLQQALDGLQIYLNEFSDYRQEALLLRAFSEFANRNPTKAEQTIDELIDTDPFLTDEHSKEPDVFRDPLEWSALLEWCQALVSGMNSSSHLDTLHALCLLQSNDKEVEAKELINAAINQAPKDPLVQGVFAFVNWHLGSDMKADMLASKAIEMNQSEEAKLPHIIKARICESLGNYECALQEWKTVQRMDEQSVSALGGISSSYLKLKKFSQFETSYRSANKRALFYKTLLRADVIRKKEGLW